MAHQSSRLPDFDYATPGAYFVTICTWRRELLFEEESLIREVERAWRSLGKYVRGAWNDTFVVMPNHVHGIIWLRAKQAARKPESNPAGVQLVPHALDVLGPQDKPLLNCSLSTARAAPLQRTDERTASQRPVDRIPPGSLGALVRGFKSLSTKRVNMARGTPGAKVWQRGYYEEVIRDEAGLERVREYIVNNPANWGRDPLRPSPVIG